MVSILKHAPITGCSILGGVLLTQVFGSGQSASTRAGAPLGWPAQIFHFLIFPVGFFPSREGAIDSIVLIAILFHTRMLERFWGSSRFLTFGLIPSLLASVTFQFLTPMLRIRAVTTTDQALTLRWIATVVALALRYYSDIPALKVTQLVGAKLSVTDKVFFYGLVAKLVLSGLSSSGIANTLIAAGIGLGSALLLSSPLVGLNRFSLLSEQSAPMRALRSLTQAVFGSEVETTVSVPTRPPPDLDDGFPPGFGAAGGRGGPARTPRRAPGAADRTEGAVRRERPASATNRAPQANPDQVEQIMALQLPGVTPETAAAALQTCGGNVDAAVHMLME